MRTRRRCSLKVDGFQPIIDAAAIASRRGRESMTHILTDISSIVFLFVGLLLIFVILLQRGRGGVLPGPLAARVGKSASGTKAGDVFTRITIGIALVWVIMAVLTGYAMTY